MIARPLSLVLAASALAVGVASSSMAAPSASHSRSPYSAVQAAGSEYALSLSRTKIKPGRLRLEFVNFGEDDHDLAIRKVGSSRTSHFAVTAPGERTVKRYRVKSGTYQLWCTIADHRARGMRATIKVSRKRR